MKLMVSYSNCQGAGAVHFLKQSPLAESYDFHHYNNYKIILKEQSADDLLADAAMADVFLYQHTPAIKYCDLSTEDMLGKVVSRNALLLSFGYGFNHGFFPLVHHGQWQTGSHIKEMARTDPTTLLQRYDEGVLDYDCFTRFKSCLFEQIGRERIMDIKMADWINDRYQFDIMFTCENHPASSYFAELARRIAAHITGEWQTPFPYTTRNDANLPCGIPVHPAVVKELELQYPPDPDAIPFYRSYLERLISDTAKETNATPP